VVLVVATLAYRDRHRSRTAERIARKDFGDAMPTWFEELEVLVAHLIGCSQQAGP
jgi:hypothetical protein